MKLVLDFNYHIWKIVINDGKSNECFQMWLNLIWIFETLQPLESDCRRNWWTGAHLYKRTCTFNLFKIFTGDNIRQCSDIYEHPINISPEKWQTYLKPVHYTSSCNPIDLKFHCLIDKRKDNQ